MTFTKEEARAIKTLVRRCVRDRQTGAILNAGHGVRLSVGMLKAQSKIISAAAATLGDEWDA